MALRTRERRLASADLSTASGYSLAGRGPGGKRSFDDAVDVVAGDEVAGLVATGLVDQERLAQSAGGDGDAVAPRCVADVKRRGHRPL